MPIYKNRKNKSWEIGQIVKCGFTTLRVIGIKKVRDGLPDIYILSSLDGKSHYKFIPHNGLHKIKGEYNAEEKTNSTEGPNDSKDV